MVAATVKESETQTCKASGLRLSRHTMSHLTHSVGECKELGYSRIKDVVNASHHMIGDVEQKG